MAFKFKHSSRDEKLIEVPAIGLSLRVPLPPEASEGAISIIETENAPGFGPPLHSHPQTEVFRILEGRYLFTCDGQEFEAEAGDVVSIPSGAVHTFVNIGTTPARQYILIIPSLDAATFFSELGEVMRDGIPDPQILSAFGGKWQVEFLGPPLKVRQS